MKRLVCLMTALAALFLVPLPAAHADSLDDYLTPNCGWSDDGSAGEGALQDRVNTVVAQYGKEILGRAARYGKLAPTPENKQLMWLLGTMSSPAARRLAGEVVREGDPAFRYKVMGGIGFAPDWEGAEVLFDGAADANPVVRETAIVLLTERVAFDAPAFVTADRGDRLDVAALRFEVLIGSETDARLRGMLVARLAALRGEMN